MKTFPRIIFLLITLFIIIVACSKSDNEKYIPVEPVVEVIVNLANVPYAKLSDYHFFKGDLKDLEPMSNVLPYEPASSVFTDYTQKKRFVWIPAGTKATYVADDKVFNFPIGAVLIKSFYYENTLPNNLKKIIETRLLIKKADGWKAFEYIWNVAQTDAILETTGNGTLRPITFIENGVTQTIDYRTPSQSSCVTCHKINPNQTGEIIIPIGPKPQNLNTLFSYNGMLQNQLTKWKTMCYLGDDVPALSAINSTIDYRDTTKSLELRARSYMDINCAHCHQDGGHCAYVPQRFNFSNPDINSRGICLSPRTAVTGFPFIITAGNSSNSLVINKMNSIEAAVMMPPLGRSIVHTEGIQLITDWINSMPATCR